MDKKQKTFFLLVLGIIMFVLLLRPYLAEETVNESSLSVEQVMAEALDSGKPLVVVFTYGAECCPSTNKFFTAYAEELRLVLLKYRNHLEVVWLNTATESAGDQKIIMNLAREYGVAQVPSLVLLNANREIAALFEGEITREQVTAALQKVVNP